MLGDSGLTPGAPAPSPGRLLPTNADPAPASGLAPAAARARSSPPSPLVRGDPARARGPRRPSRGRLCIHDHGGQMPPGLGASSFRAQLRLRGPATLPSSALGPSQHWETPRLPLCVPTLAPRLARAHLPPGLRNVAGSTLGGRGVYCCPLALTWSSSLRLLVHAGGSRMHTYTGTCSAVAGTKASGGGCRPFQGAESRALLPATRGHPGQSGRAAARRGVCRRTPPPTRGSRGSWWQLIECRILY